MDKRTKLDPIHTEICTNPEFYRLRHPQEPVSIARMLTLCAYLEGELDEKSHQELKLHLEQCSSCAREFQELQSTNELNMVDEIPVTVCPSSQTLDQYQFEKASLSAKQSLQIEKHL